jgi:hypothetical protein
MQLKKAILFIVLNSSGAKNAGYALTSALTMQSLN